MTRVDPGARSAAEPGSFLAALPEQDAQELLRRGTRRSYKRGVAIFHERQVSDSVVVVLAGLVKVSALESDKEAVLGFRGPGDILGEISTLDGEPRSATVTAVEDTEAVVLAASEFRAFLARSPSAALLLLRTLTRRMREGTRHEVEFAAFDTVGRLSARLVEMCERHGRPVGDGTLIDVPLTQEELAGWTGASREAVQRALYTLRDCGWIRTERRRIVVLDRDALERRWR